MNNKLTSVILLCLYLVTTTSFCDNTQTQPIFTLTPTSHPIVQNPGYWTSILEYIVTNTSDTPRKLTMLPWAGTTQNTSNGTCSNPVVLQPHTSCLLTLNVDQSQLVSVTQQLAEQNGGPIICKTKSETSNEADPYMCTKPSQKNTLQVATVDPNFPYGSPPTGNVCVSSDYYATPETMLGSWAMIQAVAMDVKDNALPSIFTEANVVYAVGTAAIGSELGISNCSTGCNDLNGYCFALKFNGKTPYPYMVFQSVNIGANPSSFDIYMAGGGSGAFPNSCKAFWGTLETINWGANIENSDCATYFDNYSTINTAYSVTYNKTVYPAKETLMNACTFASAPPTGTSGFNTQNWSNVTVVPVTCPTSLTQITGVRIPSTVTTIGNKSILNLSTLQESDFASSTITSITTTQMQDCKTPSSGYCGNVATSVTNYESSISANLTAPMLTGTSSNTYCQAHPSTGYCSWNNGQSSGSDYCNTNETYCLSCGGGKWCVCDGTVLTGCTA